MAHISSKVAQGDFDAKFKYSGGDEIGNLSKTFNQMISDLKAQRAQLVGKNYVDSIITNMVDSLLVFDANGTIKTANKATLELLGYKQEELIGRSSDILFSDEESFLEGPRWERLRDQGFLEDYEMSYQTKSGKKMPVSLSASIMGSEVEGKPSQKQILGIVAIARDLSERKRAETVLAAEKERLAVTLRAIGDGVITTNTEGKVLILNKERIKKMILNFFVIFIGLSFRTPLGFHSSASIGYKITIITLITYKLHPQIASLGSMNMPRFP